MLCYGENKVNFSDFEITSSFMKDAVLSRKCNEWTEYEYCGMMYVFYSDGRRERYFPGAKAEKVDVFDIFKHLKA